MDWQQLLQNFGVAVTIIIFFGFCLISFARWVAPRLDKLVDRVLLFLDRVTDESNRLDRLEERVTTIWEYLLRRAGGEAVQKGLGTMNSPLKINEEAREMFKDFVVPLRLLYKELGSKLSPIDFSLEVERRFGEEFLYKICIPHNITQGSCVLIASQIAREPDTSPQ